MIRSTRRDRGTVLPLVLVITIAIGGVVLAISTYATTSLRYGQVAEQRSDRLAAADAGLRYALDQLKLRARGCVWDDVVHTLPGIASDFNEATAQVECQRITTGLDDIKLYAAVMTGEGINTADTGDDHLLACQGGSNYKTLGGPVYMQRIDATAFDFGVCSTGAGVEIENGPLLYYDAAVPCSPTKPSVVVARADSKLQFTPDLIYGPECVNDTWKDKFDSPEIVTDLSLLPIKNGATAAVVPAPTTEDLLTSAMLTALKADVIGSYFDVSGSGSNKCRVFAPGRYTAAPQTDNLDAYFLSGEYVFDLPSANATVLARKGVLTAGTPNPDVFDVANGEIVGNERSTSTSCEKAQALDPDPEAGATFYFAGESHIFVDTDGAMEIHARKQGSNYVSVQTLCKTSESWCNVNEDPLGAAIDTNGDGVIEYGGHGGFSSAATKWSTLGPTSATPDMLLTKSGNGKEFVAHGLFYAPLAEAEFGNVSNTAIQKMRGGLIVSQLILQSATSATNFEIAVPTSPITGKIEVTSTAEKGGSYTSIRAIVEYRPYESDVDQRIAVNSWRVCGAVC